ncbi:hypothetical protein NEDG_01378 [Nematocida displodere]|uniref:Uncharacterized protein n=1 Tax=Nematocida displodere TaxID=1805483 RepID=A0A177EBI8_9MICR|nr:hypothetical protein NEDG_01378 [Nematocida displodere]
MKQPERLSFRRSSYAAGLGLAVVLSIRRAPGLILRAFLWSGFLFSLLLLSVATYRACTVRNITPAEEKDYKDFIRQHTIPKGKNTPEVIPGSVSGAMSGSGSGSESEVESTGMGLDPWG